MRSPQVFGGITCCLVFSLLLFLFVYKLFLTMALLVYFRLMRSLCYLSPIFFLSGYVLMNGSNRTKHGNFEYQQKITVCWTVAAILSCTNHFRSGCKRSYTEREHGTLSSKGIDRALLYISKSCIVRRSY